MDRIKHDEKVRVKPVQGEREARQAEVEDSRSPLHFPASGLTREGHPSTRETETGAGKAGSEAWYRGVGREGWQEET